MKKDSKTATAYKVVCNSRYFVNVFESLIKRAFFTFSPQSKWDITRTYWKFFMLLYSKYVVLSD